jgi:hypothetical protein
VNQRLHGDKLLVKHILDKSTFVAYHEDFRQDFLLKQIADNEDLERWIELTAHSNIVTCFEAFRDSETGLRFQMTEMHNGGTMYEYIRKLNLNLNLDVSRRYRELVFDVAIQIATGLDAAHNQGLAHGNFDLSHVVIQNNDEHLEFKVTNFQMGSSLQAPLNPEASYWPFARNKRTLTANDKLEVLMLRDVYCFAVSILELMIGRTSCTQSILALDALPLTWAEFHESTPLIQVLADCIQLDSITLRKGKLKQIRQTLIVEFKKFFQSAFYKLETPFVGKKADVLNKRGTVALFNRNEQEAIRFWQEARQLNEAHFDSHANYGMFMWTTAKVTDSQMMQ